MTDYENHVELFIKVFNISKAFSEFVVSSILSQKITPQSACKMCFIQECMCDHILYLSIPTEPDLLSAVFKGTRGGLIT